MNRRRRRKGGIRSADTRETEVIKRESKKTVEQKELIDTLTSLLDRVLMVFGQKSVHLNSSRDNEYHQ